MALRIISGELRGRKIQAPPTQNTRPTTDRVRSAIFNGLNHILNQQGLSYEDLNVLDPFAGSGALGFEALSRGVPKITLLDSHFLPYRTMALNAQDLNVEARVRIHQRKTMKYSFLKDKFSLIFLDPPYGHGLIQKSLDQLFKDDCFCERTILVCESDEREKLELHLPEKWVHNLLYTKVFGETRVSIFCLKCD
jgi:16S rRNA (guanine966-N2)-methyltransferase